MLSALVGLSSRQGMAASTATLWRTVGKTVHLDAHLSSDFILAFGAAGNLRMARSVLDAACDAGVASVRVHNSFLRACARGASSDKGSVSVGAVAEAEYVLARMEAAGGVGIDAYTCSLAAAILGRAGRLAEAEALIARAGDRADTVAHNALIDAAGRNGELPSALATLQRMEGEGPAPDEMSYTSVLQALVRAAAHEDVYPSIDRVGTAEELRMRMAARGIEPSDATTTSLLVLYAESEELIESVLSMPSASVLNAAHRPVNLPREALGARSVTDLRGLTRQAASAALRNELQQAARMYQTGSDVGAWAVLVGGQRAAHGQGGRGRLPSEDDGRGRDAAVPARGGSLREGQVRGVVHTAALEFFDKAGIAVKEKHRVLLVDASELKGASVRAAEGERQDQMRRGLLLQLAALVSGVAAISLVPRLLDQVEVPRGDGAPAMAPAIGK